MKKILNYFDKAENYRIERKIKIPKYLSCLLKFEFLRNGFFKQYEDKIINSIYFDDNLSSFFKSNLDGDLLRVKPRIRWYDENISLANHEFKIKKGFIGTKIVNKKILKNINIREKIIKKCNEYHDNFFHLKLHETSTIKYQRSYFIHPSKIRMTIDKKIFAKPKNNLNFVNMPFEVIEFKYKPDQDTFFRKSIFNELKRISFRMTKCSKYSESMMI